MSKSRNWCFTLNDCTDTHAAFIGVVYDVLPLPFDDSRVKYVHYQLEKAPTTGQMHYQGFINFDAPKSMSVAKEVVGFNSVHVEIMHGTLKDNIVYCSKSDTKVLGPWMKGTLPAQGSRTDLSAPAAAIKAGASRRQIAEDYPEVVLKYPRGLEALRHSLDSCPKWRDLTVTWIWGKTGTGKTRMAMDSVDEVSKIHIVHSDGQWWDGYDGQDVILFDDFYGQIKIATMLRYLDGHPLQLPVKGGFVYAKYTKVYITSNVHYLDIYKGEQIPQDVKDAFCRRINEVINKL